jgi:hypothetical protein
LISASAEDDARRLGTTDDVDLCTAQTLAGVESSDGVDMAVPPRAARSEGNRVLSLVGTTESS